MTPIELDYAFKEVTDIDKHHQMFELTKMRLQTFYLMNAQLSNESRFDSPEEMMPFVWDTKKEENIIELDESDWAELDNRYSKWHLN